MKRSKGSRSEQQLSDSLISHVNAYALAASAAGVGVLALAQSAGAQVVFSPAHGVLAPNHYLTIDMNHDGVPDFRFHLGAFAYHTFYATLSVKPMTGNGVAAGDGYGYPVMQGYSIGPGQLFAQGGSVRMERTDGSFYLHNFHNLFGPWANVKNGFVGVEFLIDGAIHYGWIRMTVNAKDLPLGVTISGYAYETVAGQPIQAGQMADRASAPAEGAPMAQPSLGALALGSQGLEAWQRK
ncbi:MAG: hypothetical protein WAL56_22455 [Candidatus Sulfotelmatobacter sp.]